MDTEKGTYCKMLNEYMDALKIKHGVSDPTLNAKDMITILSSKNKYYFETKDTLQYNETRLMISSILKSFYKVYVGGELGKKKHKEFMEESKRLLNILLKIE